MFTNPSFRRGFPTIRIDEGLAGLAQPESRSTCSTSIFKFSSKFRRCHLAGGPTMRQSSAKGGPRKSGPGVKRWRFRIHILHLIGLKSLRYRDDGPFLFGKSTVGGEKGVALARWVSRANFRSFFEGVDMSFDLYLNIFSFIERYYEFWCCVKKYL